MGVFSAALRRNLGILQGGTTFCAFVRGRLLIQMRYIRD